MRRTVWLLALLPLAGLPAARGHCAVEPSATDLVAAARKTLDLSRVKSAHVRLLYSAGTDDKPGRALVVSLWVRGKQHRFEVWAQQGPEGEAKWVRRSAGWGDDEKVIVEPGDGGPWRVLASAPSQQLSWRHTAEYLGYGFRAAIDQFDQGGATVWAEAIPGLGSSLYVGTAHAVGPRVKMVKVAFGAKGAALGLPESMGYENATPEMAAMGYRQTFAEWQESGGVLYHRRATHEQQGERQTFEVLAATFNTPVADGEVVGTIPNGALVDDCRSGGLPVRYPYSPEKEAELKARFRARRPGAAQ